MITKTSYVREVIPYSESKKKFPIGSLVSHKSYGEGRVLRIYNGFLYVLFKNTGVIPFNLRTLGEKNYLSKVELGKNNRNYCITNTRLHCDGEYPGNYYVIRYMNKLKDVAKKHLLPMKLKVKYKNGWKKDFRVYLDVDKQLIYIYNLLFLDHSEQITKAISLNLVEYDEYRKAK